MKKRIQYFLAAICLATPLVLGTATAYATDDSAQGQTQPSSEQIAEKLKELKSRIEERKTELKTRLETARKTIIENRCKAAQTIIGNRSNSLNAIAENRAKIYTNLEGRLDTLLSKLKDNPNIDTTQLTNLKTELDTKISVLKTDFAAYQQALGDLKDMDCASDPTGFQASLEAARTAREKVATDLQEIRSLIKDQITQSIQAVKDVLKDTKQQEGSQ